MVTITPQVVSCGTDLHVVRERLPDVIPLERCWVGWFFPASWCKPR